MIKARARIGGSDAVVLGLTRENIDRLLDNKPIMFDAATLGISEFDRVIIIGGETPDDIKEDLRSIGLPIR